MDTEFDDPEYRAAKEGVITLTMTLQEYLNPVQIASLLTGSALAVLQKSGGSELAESYFSEILDDVRLQAAGYLEDEPPDVH